MNWKGSGFVNLMNGLPGVQYIYIEDLYVCNVHAFVFEPRISRFRDEVEVVATMVNSWPHFKWEEAVAGEGEGHEEGGSYIVAGAMANFFQILATTMNFTWDTRRKGFGLFMICLNCNLGDI